MVLASVIQTSDDLKSVLAIAGAFSVALVAIVGGITRRVLATRAKEATKRELAAYIAEGSMRPEDAERILRSDMKKWER